MYIALKIKLYYSIEYKNVHPATKSDNEMC